MPQPRRQLTASAAKDPSVHSKSPDENSWGPQPHTHSREEREREREARAGEAARRSFPRPKPTSIPFLVRGRTVKAVGRSGSAASRLQ